jgi:hypothetical protein
MRRAHLVIVVADHDQLIEWLDEGQLGHGIKLVRIVKAGTGNCLRVVEEPKPPAAKEAGP